jgi:hypothetical protein
VVTVGWTLNPFVLSFKPLHGRRACSDTYQREESRLTL